MKYSYFIAQSIFNSACNGIKIANDKKMKPQKKEQDVEIESIE